jgi:hypothetical protein
MSGNIQDTKVDKIRIDVDFLVEDLETLIQNNENINDYKTSYQRKYKYLYKTSSALYNFIFEEFCNKDFNKTEFLQNLDKMLNLIINIQNAKISQHDASVLVGTELASQFIPQLKK